MAARSRRGAGSSAETQKENGKGESLNRKTIETIKDATGASEEDIMVMLLECNNDINETTSRLIDNPFSQVFNKKQKKKQREEERKKDGSKVIEVRRQPSTGQGDRRNRDRGPRGSLDRNGPDRNGSRAAKTGSAKPAEDGLPVEEAGSGPAEEQRPAPLPEPTPAKPTYSRAPGPPQPAAAPSPQSSWQPEIGRPTGRKTMADLFKQPPAPAAPLPTPATAHSVQDDFSQKETTPTSELGDLSLGDPAVSAPQRISSSPAAGVPLQSNQVTQDMQVQGPSPRHAPASSALGIAPVVVPPPRYPSSENIGAAPNAWGKPKPQAVTPVGGLASLLGTSQGVPGSMGLASMPAAPQAAPMPISNNDVLSVADPQITSSGLLSSSAGTQLSSSYQQQADMKAAERVILPQQVRDVTNLGLQFGNIGFDPSRSFGGSSTVHAASDDIPQQHNAPQAVPERSNAAALSSAPSPPGVDAFNAGGMASSLGSYQTSGNTGYSTFSVQAPIASQPAAAAPAPTRLQESSTTTSQAASNLFSGASYQTCAPTPSYNNYQASAAQQQQQPAGYVSSLGGYQSTQQQVPSSQPAYSYQSSTVSTSQPAYGAQQQQQQHTNSYQAAAPAPSAQSSYSQYGQYGQQQQQPQPQQHQQPAAQYGQQYDAPAAATSAPAAAAKPAVSSYDNSQYGSYNQHSTLKDFQPAPKYNAGNAHSTAAHTNYGTQSHATGQTFGANTAAASTSAPLAAAPAAQQQAAAFAAPGMQQQVPQYAAMGYGQQYPYMNTMQHYGMQSGYGGYPQHPGGYGGYPAQASGYGAAANQPNVGFQQGGGNYSHAQSSKYQGGGGYSGQGGLYGNQRMRGKDKDSYAPHAASSLYGPDGSQLHGAGPAGQYQHGGVGRDQYSYGAQGQSGTQGYGNYGGGAGQNYSNYSQYGYGGGQNAPNGQSSGFGKLS
ncbi:g1862 [Coccomyxa elongata]